MKREAEWKYDSDRQIKKSKYDTAREVKHTEQGQTLKRKRKQRRKALLEGD